MNAFDFILGASLVLSVLALLVACFLVIGDVLSRRKNIDEARRIAQETDSPEARRAFNRYADRLESK